MKESDFLLEALDQRWAQYRIDLKACRVEFSEEAVHDLRVDTRRLIAIFEIIRVIAPHPRVQKMRRIFKGQLDGFDNLRDVQVMLADISENIASLPELFPFQTYLRKREKRLLRIAEVRVREIKLAVTTPGLQKMRQSLAALPADELSLRLLQAVDKAFFKVKQRYGWIDPDQPASIHSVRVAFKKFRYMVECIRPILPDFPETQFKRMHAYQAIMGDIQDEEVFLLTLANFSARHTELNLESVKQFYEHRFSQALNVYLDDKGELDTFWHAAPESNLSR